MPILVGIDGTGGDQVIIPEPEMRNMIGILLIVLWKTMLWENRCGIYTRSYRTRRRNAGGIAEGLNFIRTKRQQNQMNRFY